MYQLLYSLLIVQQRSSVLLQAFNNVDKLFLRDNAIPLSSFCFKNSNWKKKKKNSHIELINLASDNLIFGNICTVRLRGMPKF